MWRRGWHDMERVLIVGCGGSGKSTLARIVARQTGLPLIHLDAEYWQSGWVEPQREDWLAHQQRLSEQPQWVMDGNYVATLAPRLAHADTVIWLDFPTHVCLLRVIRRWWQYRGRTRPDMTDGCPERLNLAFVIWILRFRARTRPQLLDILRGFHGAIITLKGRQDVSAFVAAQSVNKDT